MLGDLFNRVVDGKGLPGGRPDARRRTTMPREHITSESSVTKNLKWTVRNKIRKFVESGRHLIAPMSGARRGVREMRPAQRSMAFRLYAPEAGCVSLAGDFNAWSPDVCPLQKTPDGLWERVIDLPAGRHEYKFVVDGHWQDDPRCAEHTPNPFGGENCVVILS